MAPWRGRLLRAGGARRLAWSLWAGALGLVVATLAFILVYRSSGEVYEIWLEGSLISPTYATLGALLVSRRPDHRIGWIMCVAGVCGALQLFFGQYATAASAVSVPLPGGEYAAWLSGTMQRILVTGLLVLVFFFPSGEAPSERWRLAARAVWLGTAGIVVGSALQPGPIESLPFFDNPFGLQSAAPVLDVLTLGGAGMLLCLALSSLVFRFRRAPGEERLQIKWFLFAAVVGIAIIAVGSEAHPLVGSLVWTIGPLSLPAAITVAILRYRLYDIDRIINRTLVYGSLTAVLGLVYVGGVIVLPGALGRLGRESDLLVAGSTLLVAALFRPARSRIQELIDRRFNRRRYDAERTIEGFSSALRDEVDLDSLARGLVAVATATMEPESASLWLRRTGDEPGLVRPSDPLG